MKASARRSVGMLLALATACGGKVLDSSGASDADGGPVSMSGTTNPAAAPRESSTPTSRCGNGRLDVGEECDGTRLNGETCGSATMMASPLGTLRCASSCTFDVSDCYSTPLTRSTAGAGGVGGTLGGGFADGGTLGGGSTLGRGGTTASGGSTASTGGAGGSAGSSYGDPHIFTADGLEYDFQAVGEFVLLEDREDPGFVVQVRQAPYRSYPNLSVNAAVATRINGNRVAIYAGSPPAILVDGVTVDVGHGLQLSEGGRLEQVAETYTVSWPSGERIVVGAGSPDLLNVSYVPGSRHKRRLQGLLGRPDGNPDNDLTTRDGRHLAQPDLNAIYDVFGESYRIRDGESLFDYASGETTDTYTDRAFPYGGRQPPVITWNDLRDGRAVCIARGVTDEAALRACAIDVAVTGDPGFAVP